MEEITITQNGFNKKFMVYLYHKLKDRFSFLTQDIEMVQKDCCATVFCKAQQGYCPYLRKFATEHIADIIAIGYKYDFLNKRLKLPLLNVKERHILLTGLVSADYKEDKRYILRQISGMRDFSLDGIYYFKLQGLIERWVGVVDFVPVDMGVASLNGFLEFLTQDGQGQLFIKSGKVYDEEYRLLTKSKLRGDIDVLGEVLLYNAQKVYCLGETDKDVVRFLKAYYHDKVAFC